MDTTSVSVNWRIEPAEEVLGNGAKRFDTHSQTTTLGPEPESPASGPPETGGDTDHEAT